MEKSADTLAVNPRIQKWDILKFTMIFLVVLGHFADYYVDSSVQMKGIFLFIYTFHMPVFIFVCGLFSKRAVNEKDKGRIFGYLFLYVFLKFFIFLIKVFIGQKPAISIFTEGGLPWFMLTLSAFIVITIFVKDFSPVYVLSFSVLLACISGYDSQIDSFLSLSRIIVFYPFFYLGYISDHKKVEDFCDGKTQKICASIILAVFAVVVFCFADNLYWLRPLITGVNPFSVLGEQKQNGLIIRLIYYIVSGLVSCSVIVLAPNKCKSDFIVKSGQRTLAVYSFHYVFIYVLYSCFDCKSYFDRIFGDFSIIVPIVLSVTVTLFLSLKIFSVLLNYIVNPPIKKIKSTE